MKKYCSETMKVVTGILCVLAISGRTIYADNGGPSERGEKVKEQIAFFEELGKKGKEQPKRVEGKRPLKPEMPVEKAAVAPTAESEGELTVELTETMEGKEGKIEMAGKEEELTVQLKLTPEEQASANKALFDEIKKKDVDAVKKAIKEGADVNARDQFNLTPLMVATQGGLSKIVGALLEAGARVDAKDTNGKTALMYAVQLEDPGIAFMVIKRLIDKGADISLIDKNKKSVLDYARDRGAQFKGVIEAFVAQKRELKLGKPETVKELINLKLMRAAEEGNREAVEELIRKRANIEVRDKFGFTPLMRAAEKGHEGVVRELVSWRAKIDARDELGFTALMHAAKGGQSGMVEELIQLGANPTLKTPFGLTIADLATRFVEDEGVRKQILEALKTTVSKKEILEKLKTKKEKEATAQRERAAEQATADFFPAIKGGKVEAVKQAIKQGAEVNAPNEEGQTPLMLAAVDGQKKVVEVLLKAGADPTTEDKFSNKASTYAGLRGFTELKKRLEKAEQAKLGKGAP